MNTEKRKLLDTTHQYFLDIGFSNKPLDDLELYIAEAVMGYGTASHEQVNSIVGFRKMYERQRAQMDAVEVNFEQTPIWRNISTDENTAVYADEYRITFQTEKDTIPLFFRATTIFEYQEARWKIIHWHVSIPNEVSRKEDTLHIKAWQTEKAKLEKIVAEKTADLALKNRELEIEAALERVRARTMAMHQSEEFAQVSSVMFKEFHQLALINDIARTAININDEENGDCVMWMTRLGGAEISNSFAYNYLDNELWEKEYRAYQQVAKNKRKEHKYIVTHEGEAWEGLLAFSHERGILSPTEVKIIKDQGIQKWIEHIVWFAYGSLVIARETPLSDEGFNILQRFAAVFEQTYTRFLDLQKSEAQAKAIEKVFNENQRLLHSILPEPIAEQIRQGQQTVVKRFEQVSILFADIVGFTVLSEKLSPQEVVDILNGLFSKFDDLTDKYSLEKIKTIGDAYMVASGVPEEKDNHALVLFQFAQAILQAIQSYNQAHHLQLAIRIGISSGPVVAGVIGKKKFAYDLWGDTVNTAARMEAYGQANCIQVAPSSYELLKEDFSFEKIPNVEIKGKGLMDVYVWKK